MYISNWFKVILFFAWMNLFGWVHSEGIICDEVGQTSHYRVLFIGNSLTYTNNLPLLVKKEAASRGIALTIEQVTLPNYALSDHLRDGQVQELILSGSYDYVVVQQGPSSQSYGRGILMDSGSQYKQLCDQVDAKLAFFMVWPSLKYYHTFDGVIANYNDVADENRAIICPVGKVWKAHIEHHNDYSYYGPDGFHPSLKGSQVAAKIIVDSLFAELR